MAASHSDSRHDNNSIFVCIKKTRNTSSTIRVCSSFFMMIESIKTFSTPEQTKPSQLLVPEEFGTAQSQELLTLQHQ